MISHTLDLDTLLIEYDDVGPTCVRLPTDPAGNSSLHPALELVLLESDELWRLVQDHEAEPRELDFGEPRRLY